MESFANSLAFPSYLQLFVFFYCLQKLLEDKYSIAFFSPHKTFCGASQLIFALVLFYRPLRLDLYKIVGAKPIHSVR